MCDGRVPSVQKTLQPVATRVPRIVVQRANEIFPALNRIMDSVYSQKDVRIPCLHSESCSSSSHSGDEAVSIKSEESSHVQDVEDPVPVAIIGMKAEHENCLESQKDILVPGSHSEACALLSDIEQAVNIKIEKFSGVQDGDHLVPMTFVGIKTEHEDRAHQQKDVPGSYVDTRPVSSHDEIRTINIKVEISDVELEEDPLPISFPGIKAENESLLNEHPHIHSESQFLRDLCSKSFTHSSGLKRQHVNAVDRPFSCNVCNKSFSRHNYLKEHQRGERPYSCHMCNKSFSQHNHLKGHEHMHSGKLPCACHVCNKPLSHGGCWKRHKCKHAGEHISPPYRIFSCDVCNKSFTRPDYLKEHLRIHSGERPYSCHVCKKSFKQQNHLKGHERIHSGERPYVCEVCKKSFSRHSYLKAHQYTHSGKRAFSCAVCNKSFITNSGLTVHKRIHSEERPFFCAVCDESFVSKDQVKAHLRKHSGERPFSCDVCNKSYTSSSNLKVHLRMHSGERPFSCELCSKSFISNSKLKAHQRVHSGNQSFCCVACNKCFSKHSNLIVHQSVCEVGKEKVVPVLSLTIPSNRLGKILGKDGSTLYCSWHSAIPQGHDKSANRGQTLSCDS